MPGTFARTHAGICGNTLPHAVQVTSSAEQRIGKEFPGGSPRTSVVKRYQVAPCRITLGSCTGLTSPARLYVLSKLFVVETVLAVLSTDDTEEATAV